MKKIAIFGSYSGHNAGDDAILYSVLTTLSEKFKEVKFIIPVKRPHFYKKEFSEFNVEWVPLGKKYLSKKFFGWQPYYAILKSDCIIMTQNMFFDYKVNQRGFNVLKDWNLQIRLAYKLGKKIIGYNIGFGPIRTEFGAKLVQNILSKCDFIILREHEGKEEIRKLEGVVCPIYLGADPAINNTPISKKESEDILSEFNFETDKPLIGINANKYIGDFEITNSKLTQDKYVSILSEYANYLNKTYKTQLVVISTSFDDYEINKEVFDNIKAPKCFIENHQYKHDEIMGIMGKLDLLVGTRMHACVLSAAMGTPIISINYVPKVKHFLDLIELKEYSIEPDDLTLDKLKSFTEDILKEKEAIVSNLRERISNLKNLEKKAASELQKIV